MAKNYDFTFFPLKHTHNVEYLTSLSPVYSSYSSLPDALFHYYHIMSLPKQGYCINYLDYSTEVCLTLQPLRHTLPLLLSEIRQMTCNYQMHVIETIQTNFSAV